MDWGDWIVQFAVRNPRNRARLGRARRTLVIGGLVGFSFGIGCVVLLVIFELAAFALHLTSAGEAGAIAIGVVGVISGVLLFAVFISVLTTAIYLHSDD